MALSITGGNLNGGKELGRISGPLLSDNLLRNKQNLAFDTTSLYLDVNNNVVGFNTDAPVRTLTINGKSHTTSLIVNTQSDLAHLTFKNNKIQNSYNENIVFQPNQSGTPTIFTNGLGTTGNLTFIRNELNADINTNIVIQPTGVTNINSSAYVNGYLHATGNITFDGNITFGNATSDTISFGAEIATSILPNLNGTYNLGSGSLNWLTVYSTNLNTTSITSTNANITTLTSGNIRFDNITISNIANDNNLNIVTSGAGKLRINDFLNINQTGLVSHTDNTVLSFNNNVPDGLGRVTGYVKFSGSNGLVIPTGNTLQRPTNPEIGTFRYNNILNYVEVYANVSNTSTITLVVTSAAALIGDNIIRSTATAGFGIGDFIISPSAFPAGTIVLAIVTNVSITFSSTLTANLPLGSTVTVQRKWIPSIGTSPVLSTQEVVDTMDLWTLILG